MSNERARKMKVRWRLVKMSGYVNCELCNKMIELDEAEHMPPNGLIPSGFYCKENCWDHRFDNA